MRLSQTITNANIANNPRKQLYALYVLKHDIHWMIVCTAMLVTICVLESGLEANGGMTHIKIGGPATVIMLTLYAAVSIGLWVKTNGIQKRLRGVSGSHLPRVVYVNIDADGICWGIEGLSSVYRHWDLVEVHTMTDEVVKLEAGGGTLVLRLSLADTGDREAFIRELGTYTRPH